MVKQLNWFTLFAESDARDSDTTSEVASDSVATCLQDGTISQCTSTEIIGGIGSSADILNGADGGASGATAAGQPPKVVMRTKRRNSERPWSVSCLSQLTQTVDQVDHHHHHHHHRSSEPQGLANHSISESALHTLSAPPVVVAVAAAASSSSAASATANNSSMKSADSKNSLKRRRMRARKRLGVSFIFILHFYGQN